MAVYTRVIVTKEHFLLFIGQNLVTIPLGRVQPIQVGMVAFGSKGGYKKLGVCSGFTFASHFFFPSQMNAELANDRFDCSVSRMLFCNVKPKFKGMPGLERCGAPGGLSFGGSLGTTNQHDVRVIEARMLGSEDARKRGCKDYL